MLEAIIAEHEKDFEEICHYANQLAAGDHMRSGGILVAKIEEVQQQWCELKSEAEKRLKALKQAQLAQEVRMYEHFILVLCILIFVKCMYETISVCEASLHYCIISLYSPNFLYH